MKYPDITLGRVEAVWNKLGGEDGVRGLLSGDFKVVILKHIIDCDAAPYVPDGWKVEEHQKGGQFEYSAASVVLDADFYLPRAGRFTADEKFLKFLKFKLFMNANVLDYLLKNPGLIPEDWKEDNNHDDDGGVVFWGTIYRDRNGSPCVRYLVWINNGWRWDACSLDSNCSSRCLEALRSDLPARVG